MDMIDLFGSSLITMRYFLYYLLTITYSFSALKKKKKQTSERPENARCKRK